MRITITLGGGHKAEQLQALYQMPAECFDKDGEEQNFIGFICIYIDLKIKNRKRKNK